MGLVSREAEAKIIMVGPTQVAVMGSRCPLNQQASVAVLSQRLGAALDVWVVWPVLTRMGTRDVEAEARWVWSEFWAIRRHQLLGFVHECRVCI